MTREEARRQLNKMLKWLASSVEKDAVDMAISALERDLPKQPDTCPIYDGVCGYPIEFCSECPRHTKQEPTDDAISRQAALDALVDADNWSEEFDSIKALPSVTPSRKNGHWIIDTGVTKPYVCSECGEFNGFNDNFCPNCGAEMESEE